MTAPLQVRRNLFQAMLEEQYRDLFANDAEYSTSIARLTTPADLARKMTDAFIIRMGNKDGKGIQRACKALGIKYTYTAIYEHLGA